MHKCHIQAFCGAEDVVLLTLIYHRRHFGGLSQTLRANNGIERLYFHHYSSLSHPYQFMIH
jgi:hypothetical protein